MSYSQFIQKWQIMEMEYWKKDFIHLIETPYIEFYNNGFGIFYFGTICAHMAYQVNQQGEIEFLFQGVNDTEAVEGSGKAIVKRDELEGHLSFKSGIESSFKAIYQPRAKPAFYKH